jgi:type IX secretion system PorP/SprF family membrane protein
MKKVFLSIIFFFISLQISLYSQEGGVVSFDIPANTSLKLNKFIINPTFSFVREDNTFISLYNKRQWAQFENAPQTYLFSYSGKFRENDGVGLGLFQQNYGVLTTFGGIINYAHNVTVNRENNLTFGVNLGFYKSGLDNSKVVTNFSDTSLDNIPSNSILTINPGINYGTGFFDFGISANNIVIYNFQNSQIISDAPSKGFEGHIMYTGYIDRYDIFEKSKFSALLKAESRKDKTIFSTLFLFNVPKAGWLQAGYNNLYGASGGIGFIVSKRFSIGYNFEKGFGDLSNLGNSHEFFLAYMFRGANDEDDKPVVRSTKSNGKITKAQALANIKAREEARLAKLEADRLRKEQAAANLYAKTEAGKANLEAERLRKEKAAIALKEKQAKDLIANSEAEKARIEAERLSKLKEATELANASAADKARLAKEAAEKAIAEKALADLEKARLAKEAADRANASASENARLAKEAAEKAIADKARLAKEAADRANASAAENARLAKEAADKAKAEKALADAEKARLAKEALDRANVSAAENALLAKEAADKAKAEKALADAEKARLAKEALDRANASAAENARLAKEAADKAKAEKALADAEKARLAKEAADRANASAAENARLAKEAAEKAIADKARLAKEAADRANASAAEKARLAKEAADKAKAEKALADAEKARLAKEAIDRANASAAEKAQLAREAIDAENMHIAKEAADAKAKAAAEAERLRKEAEENARLEAKKGADEKQLDYVSQVLEDSNKNLQQSLSRLDSITKSRLKALDDMKKENDDSERGIVSTVVKPFVNASIERKALESLKQEIADASKDRNKFLSEYEGLLNERLKRVSNKNDAVNQSYLKKIEILKSDKLKAEQFNADLISKLDKINIDTEIEKKRRIKKADYQSGQGRYDQDRLALKRIKETIASSSVELKPTDFDYGDDEDQSNMQILKSIDNAKSGFYLILAVHKDVAKRDAFLTKMVSAGEKNVDFFYSVSSSKYFIYVDKYDSVLEATKALEAKGNKSYNGKMFVVKIEK